MLRAWFIFILVIGFFGAVAGRLQSSHASSSVERNAFEEARAAAQADSGASAPTDSGFRHEDGSVELQRESDGHFYADVRINGAPVHMLIDTGATGIALSRDDAHAAGVATSIGMNDVVGEGADGAVHGEWVSLDRMELGPLSAEGMHAIVLNSGGQSLLGQEFLAKFSSVEIHGDTMVLR